MLHGLCGDALVAECSRASDATSAAIVFQQANAPYNSELTAGLAPAVRVGIGTGEGTVTGPGVILAQRVEQPAAPKVGVVTAAVLLILSAAVVWHGTRCSSIRTS